MQMTLRLIPLALLPALAFSAGPAQEGLPLERAYVTGEGWTRLTLDDFVNVNGTEETWTGKDGLIVCTGSPIGGARSKQKYTNFELVLEWKHHVHAGNSGVFLWCPDSAFTDLKPGSLPRSGIEVQVLLTRNGARFIPPLTLQTLSRRKVYTRGFELDDTDTIRHIELTRQISALVVAPACDPPRRRRERPRSER